MKALGTTLRAELVGAGGVVERNFYLTKRYIWWDLAWFFWTVANTLTIVFIAEGIESTGGRIDVGRVTTILLCTHDLAEAEVLAERIGVLDRGRLLALEPVADLKRRYNAETLEEAFFAATGRDFEAEGDEDDDREVFA